MIVYYLDDEVALCEIFKEMIDDPKVEVQTFSDPVKFLAAIDKKVPDVVFMDYRMPKLNGEEVAKQMPPQILKYLITGEIDYQNPTLFHEVFRKPINFDLITETIQRFQTSGTSP